MDYNKWNKRLLDAARLAASWSKDESTKVGAVIASGKRVRLLSYNGFPEEIADDERLSDRPVKYKLIQHAEKNALDYCSRKGIPTEGMTMAVSTFPCSICAGSMISAGIKRVVSVEPSAEFRVRWGEEIDFAKAMFAEAGVQVDIVNNY